METATHQEGFAFNDAWAARSPLGSSGLGSTLVDGLTPPSWQLDHLPSALPADNFFLSGYSQPMFSLSPSVPSISLPDGDDELDPLSLSLRSESPPKHQAPTPDGPSSVGTDSAFNSTFLSFLGSPAPSSAGLGGKEDLTERAIRSTFTAEVASEAVAAAEGGLAAEDRSDEETDEDEGMGRDGMFDLELGVNGELAVDEGLIGLEHSLVDQAFHLLPDPLNSAQNAQLFASGAVSGTAFADYDFSSGGMGQLGLPVESEAESEPDASDPLLGYDPNRFRSPDFKDEDFDGPMDEFTPPTSLGDNDLDQLELPVDDLCGIDPDAINFIPAHAPLPPLPTIDSHDFDSAEPSDRRGSESWDEPEPTSSGRRRKRPAAAASYSWEPTPLPRVRNPKKPTPSGSKTGSSKGKQKSKSPSLDSFGSLPGLSQPVPSKNEMPATDDPTIKPYGCAFPSCVAWAEHRQREKLSRKQQPKSAAKAGSKAAKAEAAARAALEAEDDVNDTAFRTIKELRDHLAVHKRAGEAASETPFRCALDPCGKTFRSLAGLRFHFQNASANGHFFVSLEEGEERPSKKFKLVATPNGRSEKCPMTGCTKAFKQAAGLAYHLAHAANHPVTESLLVTFGATLASKTRWWFRKKGLKVGTGEIPSCMRPGNGPTQPNRAGSASGSSSSSTKKKANSAQAATSLTKPPLPPLPALYGDQQQVVTGMFLPTGADDELEEGDYEGFDDEEDFADSDEGDFSDDGDDALTSQSWRSTPTFV